MILRVLAAAGMILVYSDYLPAHEHWGTLYDSKTKERIGEIRKNSDRHFEIFDSKGKRKASGIKQGDTIEFFDTHGNRLPFEIKAPKEKHRRY